MDRKTQELAGGQKATIEGVINDLKSQGYTVKEIVSSANNINGIILDNNEIEMNKNSTKVVPYTFSYDGGRVKYFIEIDGKNHEIEVKNDEFYVNTSITDLDTLDIMNGNISVESSDSNLVTAEVYGKGQILLKSGDTVGNVIITIKEANNDISKQFNVIIKVLAEKLTLSSTGESITRMSSIKLNATVEPNDVTEQIYWFSSDENIVKVLEDGTVRGVGVGEAIVSAKCGNIVAECLIEVTNESVSFEMLESNGYTLEDLFITTSETTTSSLMQPYEKSMSSIGYRDVSEKKGSKS